MENDAVILIFAKAPIPGAVKTRLIPAIGEMAAAMLHSALTERVIETACSTDVDVVLCCAPDTLHPFFQDCADDFSIELADQLDDANLGARMLASLNEALLDYSRVILIGADCPAFTAAHLRDAIAQLASHDVVLTPAEDGGYTLIGVCKTATNMFANIDWGNNTVMAAQRLALAAVQLRWHETATLWDVDRAEDLPRLQTLKPPLAFFLPS
jgi:uncharacterized protein